MGSGHALLGRRVVLTLRQGHGILPRAISDVWQPTVLLGGVVALSRLSQP